MPRFTMAIATRRVLNLPREQGNLSGPHGRGHIPLWLASRLGVLPAAFSRAAAGTLRHEGQELLEDFLEEGQGARVV
jgi:hypothetical protein